MRRSMADYCAAAYTLNVVEDLKKRGVKLHLLDLGGDISGNGLSKLFLVIASAFAECERDRIRERISQVKSDQRAQGRYLGGTVPFGFRVNDEGALAEDEQQQQAIRDIIALRAEGKSLRTISAQMKEKGFIISHETVAVVVKSKQS